MRGGRLYSVCDLVADSDFGVAGIHGGGSLPASPSGTFLTFYNTAVDVLPFAVTFILILAVMALRRFSATPVDPEPSELPRRLPFCIGFLLIPVAGFVGGVLVTGVSSHTTT